MMFARHVALRGAAAVGLGSWRVPIPLQHPALFTASRQWQFYIGTDPFTVRRITVRFAIADRRLTRFVSQSAAAIQKPALLAVAGRDQMVDNQQTLEFFENIGSHNPTVLQYQQAAHTLEFEPNPERFLDDLAMWSKERGFRCRWDSGLTIIFEIEGGTFVKGGTNPILGQAWVFRPAIPLKTEPRRRVYNYTIHRE